MTTKSADELRAVVRDAYGAAASREPGGCGCGESDGSSAHRATLMGYAEADVDSAPDGANLGLGCGNPHAIASLRAGEVVLDLGSGAGFDCFLAARQVGDAGRVIGVDMTPEMLAKARENARNAGVTNVSFRLGEIEHLPVPDDSIDVIMSNCVINLSPEKSKVFREAFRALRPGGRLAVADIVATAPLPEAVRDDLVAYAGCVSGAAHIDEIEAMLAEAGFREISIRPQDERRALMREWRPHVRLEDFVVSALIEARKPPRA